jgi:hypothetical protein
MLYPLKSDALRVRTGGTENFLSEVLNLLLLEDFTAVEKNKKKTQNAEKKFRTKTFGKKKFNKFL